jgi:hypothetical protein
MQCVDAKLDDYAQLKEALLLNRAVCKSRVAHVTLLAPSSAFPQAKLICEGVEIDSEISGLILRDHAPAVIIAANSRGAKA